MKAVRLYRHPECERCAGYARMHHRFDWLGRFEDTTQTPPTGQLLVGEIAVQDLRTGNGSSASSASASVPRLG